MEKLFDKTMIKFILVGLFNTLVGCGTMFLLYNLGNRSYWMSSGIGYLIGSIISFFLNKYFTFQNEERSWQQVGKFAINIIVCYIIAYGLAKPVVSALLRGQTQTFQENVAMLTGICLYTGLNYFGQHFLYFAVRLDLYPDIDTVLVVFRKLKKIIIALA